MFELGVLTSHKLKLVFSNGVLTSQPTIVRSYHQNEDLIISFNKWNFWCPDVAEAKTGFFCPSVMWAYIGKTMI